VKCLLDLGDEDDVDLVVIAKRGRSAAGDFLLGGNATRLAHRSSRPLILVPELKQDLGDPRAPADPSGTGQP
jgi:nucleotide-binding universal stress UspA family protein